MPDATHTPGMAIRIPREVSLQELCERSAALRREAAESRLRSVQQRRAAARLVAEAHVRLRCVRAAVTVLVLEERVSSRSA